MFSGKYVFSQIIEFVDRYEFDKCEGSNLRMANILADICTTGQGKRLIETTEALCICPLNEHCKCCSSKSTILQDGKNVIFFTKQCKKNHIFAKILKRREKQQSEHFKILKNIETMDNKKQCKTFEIGDGMKSICVSDRYCAELEGDKSTLLLYNPETNDIWIRISVTTVEPKDKTENPMFDYVIHSAKEQGENAEIVDDKSYIFEFQQAEEDGEQIITYFYQIGYKCNSILISITTLLENSTTEKFQSYLAEIPEYIASIEEISLEKQNFFNLIDDDCRYINQRSAEILGITEEELNDFHERDETLTTIQEFLDQEKFNAGDTTEWQSLGIAFGDYIQYKYPDFQWVIIHDQYGRDFCLNYGKTTITIFPQTMISKRVEEGIKFNVKALLNGVLKTVKEMVETNQYSK